MSKTKTSLMEPTGTFLSMSIPALEFHSGTDPVALFVTSTGRIVPHKIKTKGKFFVKNTSQVRGIYTINNKYRYIWGKTPVYFFATQETNQTDPVLLNELNNYLRKNQLTELKRKDVRHGSHLRTLLKQSKTIGEALHEVKKESDETDKVMQAEIDQVEQAIETRITDLREKHQKQVDVSDAEKSYVLLEHLKKIGEIDEIEYANLFNKAETNSITFDGLVDELKRKNLVTVSEPLDLNVEDFIQDLGAQSAPELAGFVQDLTLNKKGLKDLTPVPLKSVWTPGLLLALVIGGMIGVVLLAQNFGSITNAATNAGQQPGAIKMPWDAIMGKFIYGFQTYMPHFILKWFI